MREKFFLQVNYSKFLLLLLVFSMGVSGFFLGVDDNYKYVNIILLGLYLLFSFIISEEGGRTFKIFYISYIIVVFLDFKGVI